MKYKYLLIACAFFLISSGPVLAQKVRDDAHPLGVIKAYLRLSEDQVAELRRLFEARNQAIQPISEQVHMLQRQLEQAANNDAPDPLEVGDIFLDIRMLKHQVGRHQGNFREAFQTLLTLNQKERMAQMRRIVLANRASEALDELGLQ